MTNGNIDMMYQLSNK